MCWRGVCVTCDCDCESCIDVVLFLRPIDDMETWKLNPRTAGGLSHLRTAGGGGRMTAPPPTPRELENQER